MTQEQAVEAQEVVEQDSEYEQDILNVDQTRYLKSRILDANDHIEALEHNLSLMCALTINAFDLESETVQELEMELKEIMQARLDAQKDIEKESEESEESEEESSLEA